MAFTKTIESDRILLRPFIRDDFEASYQINLDPEVTRYTHEGKPKTREETFKMLEYRVFGDYATNGFGRFAVIWKETNEFIGFSGLKYMADMGFTDLGYRFRRDFWGKGIATETGKMSLEFGFNELKLENIKGLFLPGNIASKNVLEKLGFTYEKEFLEDTELIHQYELTNEGFHKMIR
jgi:ribosomal-protein-alanine N-acetyltransferase